MPIEIVKGADISEVQRQLSKMLHESIPDQSVRALAEQVAGYSKDKIGAIFDFVHDTFPYSPDPKGWELFVLPIKVVSDYNSGIVRHLDCDDKSLLVSAMLGALGYQTRIVLVDTNGGGQINHALAEVNSPLGWIYLDTTRDFPLGFLHRSYENKVVVN